MAIGDAYADNVQYKAVVGKTSGDNDTEIDRTLLSVSRAIDRLLGRGATGFNKDTAVVVRRYPPSDSFTNVLFVDDIASKAGMIVKVDDDQDGIAEVTLVETTDFEVMPFNAPFGPEPRPYEYLSLPTPRVSRKSWSVLTEVTAIYGWPAVPSAIVDATIQLAAIWRLESPRATSQISAGFDAVIGTSKQAQDIIYDLSRVYGRIRVFA